MNYWTNIDFAQITRDIRDVGFQEVVQANHVSLLPEEDIVRQVLHDLCYDHQTPADDSTIISGDHNINNFGGDDGWRNEAIQNLASFGVIRSIH